MQVLQLGADIAQGMAFLHSRHPQVVHRDLKSSNVLLDPYPCPEGQAGASIPEQDGNAFYRAKISDFGIATFKDRYRRVSQLLREFEFT
jgi:serine/threonine protein kinase